MAAVAAKDDGGHVKKDYCELLTWPFNITYERGPVTILWVWNIVIHCCIDMCRDWCRRCSGRFHAFLNLTKCRYITHFCHYRRRLFAGLYLCGYGVIMSALYIDHYPSHMMPKLCCRVDCGKIAAAAITVNTSVGAGDSGPPTAPFDSAQKMGLVTMLWVCYMIICRRYCCIGRKHHGVGLFCDRWQKLARAGSFGFLAPARPLFLS